MKKKLSICIPVYNRKSLFKHSLSNACIAVNLHSSEAEIVISDNNSEEDLSQIVEDAKQKYPLIKINYTKNNLNLGMARNILKVVDNASSDFCWIIGSDDFVKANSVTIILDIIKRYIEVEFISCNFDLINLKSIDDEFNSNYDISDELKNGVLISHLAPTWSGKVKFDRLIDPVFNNVYLGSLMTGVFKKTVWDSFEKQIGKFNGFNTLASIYPHCFIYANTFIGREAYYCGTPLITVGEGAREWGTDTGNIFWQSSLPLIYLEIFGEIIETYRSNGLSFSQYIKCKSANSKIIGTYLLPFLYQKYLLRTKVKHIENIHISRIISRNIMHFGFHSAIMKNVARKLICRNKSSKV